MSKIRTAIVTGGASGIGARLSERLAEYGVEVYAADLAEFEASHENIHPVQLDVRDDEAWESLVDKVRSEHGVIDLLANVAGALAPGWVWAQTASEVDLHMDVNVKGVIHGCRAVADAMIEQRAGTIVNVASIAGITPVPGLSLYAASKFAVRGYSLSISHELAKYGVHVGLVCPDAVDTPMLDSEKDREEASLTFTGGTPLTTDDVVDTIFDDIIDKREIAVALPGHRGALAHVSSLFPKFARKLLPMLTKKGKKAQDSYS